MGASCFTYRVHKMLVPKGFKLPQDQQKYDGGSKATTMQSLQLHLTSVTQSWLSKLPEDSIGSWNKLERQFTSNFRSTYKLPASIEEIKACVQISGELLRSYIKH
jgi:hypothetical protein